MLCFSLLAVVVLCHRLRPGRTDTLDSRELTRIRRFSERQQSNDSIPYV